MRSFSPGWTSHYLVKGTSFHMYTLTHYYLSFLFIIIEERWRDFVYLALFHTFEYTVSGLWLVTVMQFGNMSWPSAASHMLPLEPLIASCFSFAFRNVTYCFEGWCCLLLLMTWLLLIWSLSWCQQYQPSPRAFRQQLMICSRDALFRHSRYVNVPYPNINILPGKDIIHCFIYLFHLFYLRKLILRGSALSLRRYFWPSLHSHLIHAPCCCIATILLEGLSFSPALPSSLMNWHLSMSWTLS